jgi:hypothetical protein
MSELASTQGCQMAHFQIKIQVWVNFGGTCNGRCGSILLPFGKILLPFDLFGGHSVYVFCGHFGIFYGHLVHFSSFGVLHHEKSGNPAFMYVLAGRTRLRGFTSKATST